VQLSNHSSKLNCSLLKCAIVHFSIVQSDFETCLIWLAALMENNFLNLFCLSCFIKFSNRFPEQSFLSTLPSWVYSSVRRGSCYQKLGSHEEANPICNLCISLLHQCPRIPFAQIHPIIIIIIIIHFFRLFQPHLKKLGKKWPLKLEQFVELLKNYILSHSNLGEFDSLISLILKEK
jgi:hypothetical protein